MFGVREFFSDISKFINARNVRYYSRYPPYVSEPLNDVNEINKVLKEKSKTDILLMQIKAAKNSSTNSVFRNPDIHFLVQRLMRNGDRRLARSLVDKTLETVKKIQLKKFYNAREESRHEIEIDPVVIFRKAIENTTPVLGTKKVKKSGTWYKIPSVITPNRARFLAFDFLIDSANEKDARQRFYVTLAEELIKASQNKGAAFQKKVELHKYCETNRAYAHFRWT